MSIGGALTEARSEAGLSITDVSERTRIRAAIIRDIEKDDYAACGGDFYARGHIRAIAKVVGADPVPLIEEYDAARLPPEDPDGLVPGLAPPDARPGPDQLQTSPPAGNRGSDTEPIQPVTEFGRGELPTSAALQAKLAESGQAARARLGESAHGAGAWLGGAASAAGSWLAARSDRTGGDWQGRRERPAGSRSRLTAVLALALLAAIGLLLYLLISGSSGHPSATGPHSGVAALHHRSTSATRHGGRTVSPAASSPAASQPTAALLTPASIAAFGPGGASQADNPQSATLAIDGNPRTAWHTDWYTTSYFGGLQSGTGLLLDMGQPVAISSASVLFGPAPGGALELRAGNSRALASLQPVAQTADPGGPVTIRVSRPVMARYLLVWLTRLPRNTAGTYEAYIYNIAVRGSR